MSGNKRDSAKREAAIKALLTAPNTRAAAKRANVAEATLHRWLNDPGFAEMYRSARRRVFDDALIELQKTTGEAVETLRRNLQADNENVQVRAAVALLDLAFKGREFEELEERIKNLEIRLSQTQTKRRFV